MEQDITLKKERQGPTFFKPLMTKLTAKFQKGDVLGSIKKSGITVLSILLFLGLWHLGSKALYNKEVNEVYKLVRIGHRVHRFST